MKFKVEDFKVDDEVRLINNSEPIAVNEDIGATGRIIEVIEEDRFTVKFTNYEQRVRGSQIELIEPKFKVRDKVRVVKLDDIDGIEACSKSKYTNYIGKTGEIIRYKEKNDHQYRVAFTELDDEWFSTIELELIEPSPKSLLKDGVIATERNGIKTIVFNEGLLTFNGESRSSLEWYSSTNNYDNELNSKYDKSCDISITQIHYVEVEIAIQSGGSY